MLNRYYVVDDFYGQPEMLVDAARKSLPETPPEGNFGGLTSSRSFLADQSQELFQRLLLEPSISSSTVLNGHVRFTRRQDKFKQYIHFDGGTKTKWAGVVYLSKEHPNVDGTTFWRHRETGLESIPMTVEGLAKHGWKSNDDLRRFLETDGMDESKWDKVFTVPYRYNRLILFRPWMFHAPGPAFGDDLDTARVIQTLFFGN